MHRRSFLKNTALFAVSVSATGFIRFNGTQYVGDCETTTDILGPFYRPNAPVRTDMRISGEMGQKVMLSGKIKHKDCTTPLKNACVELWHCDANGVYDNTSPDFKYRAKTYCDDKGNYRFESILPVPYDAGGGAIRPAHFHMMITAEGYQALITQLYFSGDKHIATDNWASSPTAKKRILDIKNGEGGIKAVSFDVTMMEKIPADAAVIDRLTGTYVRKNENKTSVEFFKRDAQLWIKNTGSINGGYPLQYIGNNTFEAYGENPAKYQFIPQHDGTVKISFNRVNKEKGKTTWEAVKGKP
jgi:protocatechuate 3,4-dioxygenase beta subunit